MLSGGMDFCKDGRNIIQSSIFVCPRNKPESLHSEVPASFQASRQILGWNELVQPVTTQEQPVPWLQPNRTRNHFNIRLGANSLSQHFLHFTSDIF